jgi:hypothetical protein
MKKIILGILAFTALASAVSVQIQAQAPASASAAPAAPAALPALTADEIVNKNLDALGGKDAISKIKTLSTDATMQVMGNEAPSKIVVVDGVGVKSESEFNGMKIISVYTDKGGWTVNPMAGAADPTPMPDDQYNAGKGGIFVGGLLSDYAAKGSTIALASQDDKTYTIKLTTKEKQEYSFVIDGKTFLVNSETTTAQMQGQPVTLTTSYSDYRKTDGGFVVPYSMGMDFGGQFQLSLTVNKIELNKTVDPAVFAMPKAGS